MGNILNIREGNTVTHKTLYETNSIIESESVARHVMVTPCMDTFQGGKMGATFWGESLAGPL